MLGCACVLREGRTSQVHNQMKDFSNLNIFPRNQSAEKVTIQNCVSLQIMKIKYLEYISSCASKIEGHQDRASYEISLLCGNHSLGILYMWNNSYSNCIK